MFCSLCPSIVVNFILDQSYIKMTIDSKLGPILVQEIFVLLKHTWVELFSGKILFINRKRFAEQVNWDIIMNMS